MPDARRCFTLFTRCALFIVATLVPSLVSAQATADDETPPTITMPMVGSYTTSSVVIDIRFQDQSNIVKSTMVMTVNGVNVTSGFTWPEYEAQSLAGTICRAPEHEVRALDRRTSRFRSHAHPAINTCFFRIFRSRPGANPLV